MCGIAGKVCFDGSQIPKGLIESMTQSIRHRGPDDIGHWKADGVALGHTRLSIRELSSLGHQPLADSDERVVVSYNGEIYNYDQLRKSIVDETGAVFRSQCDTELLPNGYLARGSSIFQDLEGMFAIALWDTEEHALYLARDSIGIKPLYYYYDGVSVVFASEIKALIVDPTLPEDLDPQSLATFLALGYAGPDRSLIKGVKQVPPGCFLRFDANGVKEVRYWTAKRTNEIVDPQEALSLFQNTWDEVIDDITLSDVPVAVLQSGGIDSSLISLALKRRHPDKKFSLYTGQFSEKKYNEGVEAKGMAEHLGYPYNGIDLDVESGAESTFRKMVRQLDGQLADSSSFAVYGLMEAVAKDFKVVLSGDGADEFFAGYPTYKATWLASIFSPMLPQSTWRQMGQLCWSMGSVGSGRTPLNEIAGRFCDGLAEPDSHPHAEWRRLTRHSWLQRLLQPKFVNGESLHPCQQYASGFADFTGTERDRALLMDQRYYLPADMLMKMDSMSMAHGLEVRVPFLDRRIMELANRIDVRAHADRLGTTKKILRKAFAQAGGNQQMTKRAKTGFNVPIASLLRGGLKPLGERRLMHELDRIEAWICPDAVRTMWLEHQSRKKDHAYALWALLTFAEWRASI